MFKQDLIKRALERTAEAVAKALGLKKEGELEEALAEINSAYDELLRIDRRTFDVVDSHTLAGLIGPVENLRSVAELSRIEGEIHEAAGRPKLAAARYRRALELMLEADEKKPVDDAGRAAIAELAARVPREQLMRRYHHRLD